MGRGWSSICDHQLDCSCRRLHYIFMMLIVFWTKLDIVKFVSQPAFDYPNRPCTGASQSEVLDIKMQLWHSLWSMAPPHVRRNVAQNARSSSAFRGGSGNETSLRLWYSQSHPDDTHEWKTFPCQHFVRKYTTTAWTEEEHHHQQVA